MTSAANRDLLDSLKRQYQGLKEQLEATTDQLLTANGAEEVQLEAERNLIVKKIAKVDQQIQELQLVPETEILPGNDREAQAGQVVKKVSSIACNEDSSTVYLILAIFWQEKTPPRFRVSPQLCYRKPKQAELVRESLIQKDDCCVSQKDFPAFLNGLVKFTLSKLAKLFPDPLVPWKLTIALFVPVELLGNPLTDWCGVESPILQERVLVLGCSDRFNPHNPSQAADLHNSLKRGWQTFQGCSPDGMSLEKLKWLDSRDLSAQTAPWEKFAGMRCYGNWLKPGAAYLSHWQKLVKAGIPLALWMSESQLDTSDIKAWFSQLVSGDRFAFLERIREVRQAQREAGSAIGYVGILYEDPRYTPPVPQAEEEFFVWPGT